MLYLLTSREETTLHTVTIQLPRVLRVGFRLASSWGDSPG